VVIAILYITIRDSNSSGKKWVIVVIKTSHTQFNVHNK